MLESYLHKFASVRTDRGRNRYPTATNHRAPHKPFLLLSVMDLIAQGQIIENFIDPSFELVDTWNGYWKPSSNFTITAARFVAFACGPRKGTPWWRPPTSCPGAKATTIFPATVKGFQNDRKGDIKSTGTRANFDRGKLRHIKGMAVLDEDPFYLAGKMKCK